MTFQPLTMNAQSGDPVSIAPFAAPVPQYVIQPSQEVALTHAEKLALLQQKIKYVFVLFQENRSFDFHFGTYPGADGLYSKAPGQTPGFVQPLVTPTGQITTISPFKIPNSIKDVNGNTVPLYPADTASVNHAHTAIDTKLDQDSNGIPRNDKYALVEEGVSIVNGQPSKLPTLEREQFGELVMAHIDCDTIPFLWNYANRFTLMDNFFDTVIGPSTPNAIAMVAGQSGETQWVEHPEQSSAVVTGSQSVPVVGDPDPYWGSSLAPGTPPQPEPGHTMNPAPNLTFASLPLSFMGSDISYITSTDSNPAFDLTDVQGDIAKISSHRGTPVNWGWYQQGYNHESTDGSGAATNNDYIAHHNAPQYFGYIANNSQVSSHLHGLTDFYNDVKNQALPAEGGVFYVRGGYNNLDNLPPVDPNPKLATVFNGSDDHPGYSDAQISETLIANEINAITNSPYWANSAIIITYDESDGLYDHAQPVIRSQDPQGASLDQGPRIPAIVISPYGVVHGISHERDEHSSIIKFIDELHNLIPLADLPDELRARVKGKAMYGQSNLGPADDLVDGVGDLFTAFDNNRLAGNATPIPASYAQIPQATVLSLPHYGGQGCQVVGVTPTDAGRPNPVPADFNPRPDTNPGIPASGTWVP